MHAAFAKNGMKLSFTPCSFSTRSFSALAQRDDGAHVDLVERREVRRGVLRLRADSRRCACGASSSSRASRARPAGRGALTVQEPIGAGAGGAGAGAATGAGAAPPATCSMTSGLLTTPPRPVPCNRRRGRRLCSAATRCAAGDARTGACRAPAPAAAGRWRRRGWRGRRRGCRRRLPAAAGALAPAAALVDLRQQRRPPSRRRLRRARAW